MSTRQRSAWRRKFRNNRTTQVAITVSVAVVAVVGAVIGLSLANDHVQAFNQVDCRSVGPSAGAGASAAPCPAQTGGAPAPAVAAAKTHRVAVQPNTFGNGPIATKQLGGIATRPVDGAGEAINLKQNKDEAADSGNCTLVVPPNPLTAQGLATPYQLGDGCTVTNPDEQAFVEATILSRNGQVQVYNPLVIDQGTRPAIRPIPPKIQPGSQVTIDFGFNGTNLLLTGPGAVQRGSGCVDALGQSVIGQVAACNSVAFYNLANAEIAKGILRVPKIGTSQDGQACETTRDFALIDQDQSDNVYSAYLVTGNGQTAQATKANQARLRHATLATNGSDNALLGLFIDPANGCKPFTRPDPTSLTGTQGSQALDELSARVNQKAPVALLPTNDEMVLVNGNYSIDKTNVFRSLVDQPLLAANVDPAQVAAAYCMNMVNIAPAHDQLDMAVDAGFATPVPDTGNNLATFIGNRLAMSFDNLGCGDFGLTNPVDVTTDENDVATAVAYHTGQQQATLPAPAGGQGNNGGQGNHGNGNQRPPSRGDGYHFGYHHRYQAPSGM